MITLREFYRVFRIWWALRKNGHRDKGKDEDNNPEDDTEFMAQGK